MPIVAMALALSGCTAMFNAASYGTSDLYRTNNRAEVAVQLRAEAEGIRSKMIMQVHDEVVVDTLNEELESVKRIVKEAMESVASLRVPLIAEVNSAENWLDAH